MEFKYKAKKELNNIIEGKIEADSLEQVIEKLERQGMAAISVEPERLQPQLKKKSPPLRLGKWSLRQLTLFTQKLYNLTKSRVDLLVALRLLAATCNDSSEKALLENIIKNIKDGMMFSQCLESYPQSFPPLYVNIIRTGESSGMLRDALAQLLSYLQRIEGLRMKVRQAVAYPIFMVLVGIGMIFVMLTFILPRLASMFEDFQATLPLPTLILLGISNYLKNHWLAIIISLALIVIILKKSGLANYLSKIKYHLPLIKGLIYKQAVADFSTSTALLLKSGVNLLATLELAAPVINNPAYIKQLEQVRRDIKDGVSFSQALQRVRIFSDFFIQMMKVGEAGGRLDDVLEDIAEAYEQEIETDLKIISSLLEPAIILVLGLVIGGIVMAVLLPIFNINTLVGS